MWSEVDFSTLLPSLLGFPEDFLSALPGLEEFWRSLPSLNMLWSVIKRCWLPPKPSSGLKVMEQQLG